jgi:outer membrane protein assembly factor BamA
MFWRLYHAHALFLPLFLCVLQPAHAQMDATLVASPAIRSVTFERTAVLSATDRQNIAQILQQKDPAWVSRQSSDALASFIKSAVLAAYRDQGYWRANVSTNIRWRRGSKAARQVDVRIRAINEGARYSLKEIRFTGATVFPTVELIGLMPIHAQDPISSRSVEKGLEAMRELYVARGYVAFTATPHAEFDDSAHTVALNITLQEDSPFRFGNLTTDGIDEATSLELRQAWTQMRDQSYSAEKLRSLLRKSFALPSDADPLDYSVSNLDFDTHTVDVLVSFPPTTQAEKAER